MENPIKMDDLGVPLFLETSICAKNTFPIVNKMCLEWGCLWPTKKLPCFPGESQNPWLNLSEWQWQIVERFF